MTTPGADSSATNSMIPAPPTIPSDTVDAKASNDENQVQEPPLKRMKVDATQIPSYNSHNIYSRPAAPASNIKIPSLPSIVAPVNPLDFLNDTSSPPPNNATLPSAQEEWPLCALCHKGGDMSRCSSCRQAYYCDRKCQLEHWQVHCIVCRPGPPQPPSLPQAGQPVAPPHQQHEQYHERQQNGRMMYNNGHSSSGSGGGVRRGRSSNKARQNKSRPARGTRSTSFGQADDGSGKEQYYCEECDRFFKNGQALGGHRSRVHSSRRNGEDGGPATAGADGSGAAGGGMSATPRKARTSSRSGHEISSNGQYVCPYCGREFSTGNALGGHISGAHTKKARKLEEQQQQQQQQYAQQQQHGHSPRFARPRHPNM